MSENQRVLRIKDGDILCVTNMGQEAISLMLASTVAKEQTKRILMNALPGVRDVIFFVEDVDFAVIR